MTNSKTYSYDVSNCSADGFHDVQQALTERARNVFARYGMGFKAMSIGYEFVSCSEIHTYLLRMTISWSE